MSVFNFGKKEEAKKGVTEEPSNLNLDGVIANLEDGVIVYNLGFRVVLMNKAAESLLGIKSNEVLGKAIAPENVKDAKLKLLTQIIFPSLAPLVMRQTGDGVYPQVDYFSFTEPRLELRVLTDRILDVTAAVSSFVKIIHDRTREIELSHSKSEFITLAAHQLRTPLTAINWTFENLDKSQSLSEEDRALVDNGLILAGKVLKTVNDLLDVSKIEEGHFGYNFQNSDLMAFLEEILKTANPIAKQYGVNLYFNRESGEPLSLMFDANKLGLVVSNLIDNAIRYNTPNGSVTITAKKLIDKPYIQVGVKDTGIGIPPDEAPKLFGKFFRATNALAVQTEGTGLGLYICKNIITRHGGSIWVESTLGRGSTFYFTLPTDPSLIPPKEVFIEE